MGNVFLKSFSHLEWIAPRGDQDTKWGPSGRGPVCRFQLMDIRKSQCRLSNRE